MIGALKEKKRADVDLGKSAKGNKQSQAIAFVIFRPKSIVARERLWYNEAALQIFALSLSPSKVSSDHCLDVSALCSKWAKSLEKRRTEHESGKTLSPETDFIDVILSGRRQYGVRGFIMAPAEQKQFLFILKRTGLKSINLEMLFRNCNRNEDLWSAAMDQRRKGTHQG